MSSFQERFWDRLCLYQWQLFILLVFDVSLLVVSLVLIPFVESGSAGSVLLWLDIALFGVLLAPLAYVQYRCRQRIKESN